MNKINPNHRQQNGTLKVLGPIILIIGLIFAAIGLISFFSAFSGSGRPTLFWCAFIGLPMSAVGMNLCRFAFMGKVARYTAGELAPVAKDTFNYMAKETQEGVSDVTQAIAKGAQGSSRPSNLTIEERIKKLEKMKQSGLINEEDFEEQKDRILSEI